MKAVQKQIYLIILLFIICNNSTTAVIPYNISTLHSAELSPTDINLEYNSMRWVVKEPYTKYTVNIELLFSLNSRENKEVEVKIRHLQGDNFTTTTGELLSNGTDLINNTTEQLNSSILIFSENSTVIYSLKFLDYTNLNKNIKIIYTLTTLQEPDDNTSFSFEITNTDVNRTITQNVIEPIELKQFHVNRDAVTPPSEQFIEEETIIGTNYFFIFFVSITIVIILKRRSSY